MIDPGPLQIALLPGSIRRDSVHRRLARALVPLFEAHGANVEVIDLGDHPMSMYHGDDEAAGGAPTTAVTLADRIRGFDGVVILSPEYNGGPSALLKNAIDWVTRVDRGVLRGLLIGLTAASPGQRGARHGLSVMRQIGAHMQLDVLSEELSIPSCGDAFGVADEADVVVRSDAVADAEAFVEAFVARLSDRLDARDGSAVG